LWYRQKEGQVVSTTCPDTVHIIGPARVACINTWETQKTLDYRHGVHRTEMREQKILLGIHLVHYYKGKRGFSLKIIEESENNQLGVREL
jgi:hypothetical protein